MEDTELSDVEKYILAHFVHTSGSGAIFPVELATKVGKEFGVDGKVFCKRMVKIGYLFQPKAGVYRPTKEAVLLLRGKAVDKPERGSPRASKKQAKNTNKVATKQDDGRATTERIVELPTVLPTVNKQLEVTRDTAATTRLDNIFDDWLDAMPVKHNRGDTGV